MKENFPAFRSRESLGASKKSVLSMFVLLFYELATRSSLAASLLTSKRSERREKMGNHANNERVDGVAQVPQEWVSVEQTSFCP
jgi:hypothetical protein